MTSTDYMCQEKEKEELPALKTDQYNDLKIAYKRVREEWLQPPETILTKRRLTEQQ